MTSKVSVLHMKMHLQGNTISKIQENVRIIRNSIENKNLIGGKKKEKFMKDTVHSLCLVVVKTQTLLLIMWIK